MGGCRPTRSLAAPPSSPVLSRGMDRANNIFDQIDTDKSGGIDKGEITIHLLSLGQEQETVMEMLPARAAPRSANTAVKRKTSAKRGLMASRGKPRRDGLKVLS